jgi:hypothetical protein
MPVRMQDEESTKLPESGQDVLSVDPQVEAEEQREAAVFSRIGVYIAPVVVAHLALLYFFANAVFGFRLPAFLHSDAIVAWLWVNGGAVALGVWLWKKGRVPIGAGKWVRGRRARWAVLLWLGASLACFLLPPLLADAWRALFGEGGEW